MYLLFIFMFASCDFIITAEINDMNFDLNSHSIFPSYWDWREAKMVSPVKDQKTCAACWAFSAVANIESQLKIHFGTEETLSEQFLIDCNPNPVGCNSTSVLKTFSYIVAELGGVLRNRDYYPYSNEPKKCRWEKNKDPIPVIGYRRVKKDENIMLQFLFMFGPLSAVDPYTGKETNYWIIKNSWGTEWGDKGFYYLVRGRNACGIAEDVSFAIVE